MSQQPRKQRTKTERAPLHQRHDQVRATLSDDLREEYGRRSVRVNQGDTVEVMRGDDAGADGEVVRVDLSKGIVHVEGVTLETSDGEEVPRPVDTSNLRVTTLNLDDERREARLDGGDDE